MLALATTFGAIIGVFPGFSVTSHAAMDKVVLDPTVDGALVAQEALYQTYLSAQDKINADPYMYHYAENDGYALYCNPFTGEVYTKDKVTGQILTSNRLCSSAWWVGLCRSCSAPSVSAGSTASWVAS